ncbi:MAG: CapA family protein [Clostridia bacterium]|nr:CapA family protein [Clostridia bacterium]
MQKLKWGFVLLLALLCAAPAMGDGNKTVRITFTGDVTLGCEEILQREPYSFVGYAQEHGYGYFFERVRGLFLEDDLTVVNFEGVLADNARGENKSKNFRFRGDTEFTQILQLGSVEAVNLANNHTKDYGNRGVESTHAALDAAGIARFGERDVYILEKDGVRIAFFGAYYKDFADHRAWYEQELARLDEEVNAIVFVFHAGREYAENRISSQEEYARFAIERGADLVVMHHPHVVQGMDIIDNRSVLYSLGNFCFGGNRHAKVFESLVVSAELEFDAQGAYTGQQICLYPAFTTGTDTHNNYQPYFVAGEEAAQVLALVQKDTPFALPVFDEAAGCAKLPYLPAQDGKM